MAFQHLNRAQDELELRLLRVPHAQRAARNPPHLLTERSKAWVNTFGPPRFLKDGRRFLWLSERDGFAHLYLCDLAGRCRAVTQGPWMVDSRVSFAGAGPGFVLDERSGFVYFTATEKDPRERHLYRVRLDGTGRTRLTREDGTHRTVVSPDGRFYADTWSDIQTPPRAWVTSQDGTRATARGERRAGDPEYERGSLEWVELKAADGTTALRLAAEARRLRPRAALPGDRERVRRARTRRPCRTAGSTSRRSTACWRAAASWSSSSTTAARPRAARPSSSRSTATWAASSSRTSSRASIT